MNREVYVNEINALAAKYGISLPMVETRRTICRICQQPSCPGREEHRLIEFENQTKRNGK